MSCLVATSINAFFMAKNGHPKINKTSKFGSKSMMEKYTGDINEPTWTKTFSIPVGLAKELSTNGKIIVMG